jgi:hypothetical protein
LDKHTFHQNVEDQCFGFKFQIPIHSYINKITKIYLSLTKIFKISSTNLCLTKKYLFTYQKDESQTLNYIIHDQKQLFN